MTPLTVVLAVVGIVVGSGATTAITQKRLGTSQEQAKKELAKAKKKPKD